ncbi:ABC transporter ATP-binding protein [Ignisphaera sp. 4213-co]|uniref:ABC transporter ATP-binding protein n=1 Tax=Ignisphaera cupida TaxID=3050454 RepID=A0ABD4Z4N2_9CREN|nr:ABC transporter ATP-binding protein [Ignisphaera sp. 4213-co]MDK6027898.1 ABC transporter ATP-binding protein [Ignisphaera sp. 4213-co]
MDFEIGLFGRKRRIRAVDNVSLGIGRGEIYGLVGESGSGKSTIGRITLRLYKPTSGKVFFDGRDITNLSENRLRELRRKMQLIPQDPYSAINPAQTIGEALTEPLIVHEKLSRLEALEKAYKALEEVGLVPPDEFIKRRPYELSGGQLQRVVIARAMLLGPSYVVADEPTSNLDASIRASIIKLLLDFKNRYNLSMLFITHDIALISLIANRIGVLYLGQLVEEGPAEKVVSSPLHPYTKALLTATPLASEELEIEKIYLKGEIGDPSNPPKGCRLHPRCPFALEKCRSLEPPTINVGGNRFVKCWLYS